MVVVVVRAAWGHPSQARGTGASPGPAPGGGGGPAASSGHAGSDCLPHSSTATGWAGLPSHIGPCGYTCGQGPTGSPHGSQAIWMTGRKGVGRMAQLEHRKRKGPSTRARWSVHGLWP